MKTMLFCTYKDGIYSEDRLINWIDFYAEWGYDIHVINDGPAFEVNREITVHGFDITLGRISTACFPGWHRSFFQSLEICKMGSYEKIIHCESDAFVLSFRLKEFIEKVSRGWNVLWCPRHNMPETAIQVICQDQFDGMEKFSRKMNQNGWKDPKMAEDILPFTNVIKSFQGDRYPEYMSYLPDSHPDYATQWPVQWGMPTVR